MRLLTNFGALVLPVTRLVVRDNNEFERQRFEVALIDAALGTATDPDHEALTWSKSRLAHSSLAGTGARAAHYSCVLAFLEHP